MIDRNQFVNLVQRGVFDIIEDQLKAAFRDVTTATAFRNLREALQGRSENETSDLISFSLQVENVEFVFSATKADKDVDDLLQVCCVADSVRSGECTRVLEIEHVFHRTYLEWLEKVHAPALQRKFERRLKRIAQLATEATIETEVEELIRDTFTFVPDVDKDAIFYVLDGICDGGKTDQKIDRCTFVGDLSLELSTGSTVTLRVEVTRHYFRPNKLSIDVTLQCDGNSDDE